MRGRTTPGLTAELLVRAYQNGIFPMAKSKNGPIEWFSPDPRCIIPIEEFHVPRSLRRLVERSVFQITANVAFSTVISACARRQDTWISPEIVRAYTELHAMGYAHSIEAWLDERCVGGLYGVAIGAAFFGESMFSEFPNASKVCLVHLVQLLRQRGCKLLDSQIINDHIAQFGAIEISRDEYLVRLREALACAPILT